MAAVGTDENLQALARELQSDMDARVVRRVFAESRGPDTVAEAYTQQRALRDVRLARGEEIAGFKIGYTSPSVRKGGFATMGTPPHPTPATPAAPAVGGPQASASGTGIDHSVHGYLWDTEQHPTGATIDHRRLGIEGELAVTLVEVQGDDVAGWVVDYEPCVEIHMMGMDGPDEDNRGRRGLELIGTNCIHAGVV